MFFGVAHEFHLPKLSAAMQRLRSSNDNEGTGTGVVTAAVAFGQVARPGANRRAERTGLPSFEGFIRQVVLSRGFVSPPRPAF